MIEIAIFTQWVIFILSIFIVFRYDRMTQYHPNMVYLTFHGLVFVFRPTVCYVYELSHNYNQMQITPTDLDIVSTFLATSVALIVFLTTCSRFGRASVSFGHASETQIDSTQRIGWLATAMICLPLGLYSAWSERNGYTVDAKQSGTLLVRGANGNALHTETTGYITDAQYMIAPVIMLLIIIYPSKIRGYLPFIIFLAWRAYQGWGRWSIVLNIAILVLMIGWRSHLIWPKLKVFLIAIPVMILFHALGENRELLRSVITGDSSSGQVQGGADKHWYSFLDALDFGNFDFLLYILKNVPENSRTYTFGTQYLQIFTEPIPRILWTGKPPGAPIELVKLNSFGNFTGMTSSIVGDGWLSGGWIGLVITMFIVGSICGKMHAMFWQKQDDLFFCLLYLSFLPLTIQWFRDGGISIAKFLFFTWMPLLIWIGLCSLFARYGSKVTD